MSTVDLNPVANFTYVEASSDAPKTVTAGSAAVQFQPITAWIPLELNHPSTSEVSALFASGQAIYGDTNLRDWRSDGLPSKPYTGHAKSDTLHPGKSVQILFTTKFTTLEPVNTTLTVT